MDNIERQYFTFFLSYYNCIDKLPEEMQLPLYRAITRYSLFFEDPDFSKYPNEVILMAIWEGLLPNLMRSNNNYLRGKKGGCPKGTIKPSMRDNQNACKTKPEQNLNESQTKLNQNQIRNKNKEIRNMKQDLLFPFGSKEFRDVWDTLSNQPKWKQKTVSALQACLNQLSKYDEEFAIELMMTAIANNYQGVVFSNTNSIYEKWKKDHIQPSSRCEDLYKDYVSIDI